MERVLERYKGINWVVYEYKAPRSDSREISSMSTKLLCESTVIWVPHGSKLYATCGDL